MHEFADLGRLLLDASDRTDHPAKRHCMDSSEAG